MNLVEFATKLEEAYKFPCEYKFKFVIPNTDANESGLRSILNGCEVSTRNSKTDKYVSFTASKTVASSGEIISIYSKAAKIPGIVSL